MGIGCPDGWVEDVQMGRGCPDGYRVSRWVEALEGAEIGGKAFKHKVHTYLEYHSVIPLV